MVYKLSFSLACILEKSPSLRMFALLLLSTYHDGSFLYSPSRVENYMRFRVVLTVTVPRLHSLQINEPLKTLPQYSLPHSRTCCLLLSNSLNRRSLAISARSPFICHTPCGTRWRNLSTLVASYSIHIPYRPCLHCAPRRYPTVQLSSHVSCSCLGLMRWDCRNGSEAMRSLPSTAKSEIIVVRSGH